MGFSTIQRWVVEDYTVAMVHVVSVVHSGD